MNGQANRSELT